MPGFGRAERRNMPKKQFSEEFKKKTIKNMIRFGLTKKEAAHKVKVTETALGYWEDKYYYEAAEMALIDTDVRRTFAKIKREVIWHQVDGIAGYYG